MAFLLGVVIVRTAGFRPVALVQEAEDAVAVPAGAAERLGGAIRIATISHQDPSVLDAAAVAAGAAAFRSLHAYLEGAFPRVHARLRREVVAHHSLLYTWPGSDPTQDAILLMGHLDVVPVEAGTEAMWSREPFGGRVDGGFVWGRGAIDNKSAVLGILEAVELLLESGFQPARTVHLAFGHDEEVGGTEGARRIAAILRSRGTRLEMVLDEGGVIGTGLFPGVETPIAMIGIAEKGFLSVELIARTEGGHSSLPPAQSAVGIVSAAIASLESQPMPARLEGPTLRFFERIGPRLPLLQRGVFANLWLTRPLVVRRLERSPTTNAMVRTTAAATMFQAGTKDNVLPSLARAVVNLRILPGDTTAKVLEHVRTTVDDPRVEVRQAGRFAAEPSKVSSVESESFLKLERVIRSTARDAVVAPFQVVVVTDARYFEDLAADVYRFLPLRLEPEDLARIHGPDERIGIRDYEAAIRIYRRLLIEMTEPRRT